MRIPLKNAGELVSDKRNGIFIDNGVVIPADKVIFFDVECVVKYETLQDFQENDPTGYELFKYKYEQVKFSSTDDRLRSNTIEEFFNTSAGLYPEYNKIVCISVGIEKSLDDFSIVSIAGDDERELLLNFVHIINKLTKSKKYVCGHNIETFDIPLIVRKLLMYEIMPPTILYTYKEKPWESKQIDTIHIWRKYGSASDARLASIAYCLGLPSPKDNMSGADVHKYYYDGRLDEICTYCEADVRTVYDIYLKFNNLYLTV